MYSDSLDPFDLHIWLCRRKYVADSDQFSREILSRYVPVAPEDWQFSVGRYGKPAIVNAPIALDFNLSHSRQWLVCAVTAGSAIGVDIEYCDPDRQITRLARRFYQPRECEAMRAVSGAERVARFYDFWTLKEAHVKARGAALGHQLALSGFALSFPEAAGTAGGVGEIVQEPAPSGSQSAPNSALAPDCRAYYYLIDLPGDYRLASCWLSAPAGPPRLTLYEWRGGDDVQPGCHSIKARSPA